MVRYKSWFNLASALQCSLAAGVFSIFCFAQIFAYLLYLYPASEWLWFLSLNFNREAAPLLEKFDAILPLGPLASCAVLVSVCFIPYVFYFRRSWLGVSVSGHLALLVALIPVTFAILDGDARTASTNLSVVADFASQNVNVGLWLMAVSALLPLCILNHVAFFRDLERSA